MKHELKIDVELTNAEIPKYKNNPIKTGKGTCVNRYRGFGKKTHDPIKAWIDIPVRRCSIAPWTLPFLSNFDRALT
jgi:hypothetical protein